MALPTFNIKPLHDYIWVDPLVVPEKNPSKLVIIEADKDQHTRAIIIDVGPGRYCEKLGTLLPMPAVKTGDVVIFNKGSIEKVVLGKETAYMIKASQLIGLEEI